MKDLFFCRTKSDSPRPRWSPGKCWSELASATRRVAWLICADRRPHRAHLEIVSFRVESGVRPGEGDVETGHLVHLFNTLDGGLHEFVPFRPRAVPMHPCGPTVYAYWQTGNPCS
jgi:hypothetical protein